MKFLLAFLLSCLCAHAGLMVNSSSLNRPISTVVTDASVTPTTNQTIISGGMSGVRVWTGEQTVSEAYFYLYVSKNGGAADKVQIFRWMGRIIPATSGDTISFGTSNGRTIYVTPMYAPAATETITGVTGTANCDKAGPPIWSATNAHVILPANSRAFKINSDATERDVFIKEFDGRSWTPTRWLRLEAARSVTVRTSYRKVAIANYAGATLSITAPLGTIIGGTQGIMSLPIPAVTGTTHNCTTVAQFKTAITNAVSGDYIVLAAGTYTLDTAITRSNFVANHAIGGKVGMEGIVIKGATGNRDDVVITGDGSSTNGRWLMYHNGSTRTLYSAFKDLTFNFAAINAKFEFYDGNWLLENVRWTGVSSAVQDLCGPSVLSVTGLSADLLWCQADNSAADCFNGTGLVGNTNSNTRLIGCVGTFAGPAAADQCLTTHTTLPVEAYGCTFSDAPANAVANDTDASPCYLFFVSTSNGTRKSGVLNSSLFACTMLSSLVASNVSTAILTNGFMLFTRSQQTVRQTGTNSYVCEHNVVGGNAGLLRCFHPSKGSISYSFNILNVGTEGFRVNDSSGAVGTVTLLNNTAIGLTTSAWGLNDATLNTVFVNNAAKGNTRSIDCTVTSNGLITTRGHNVLDPTVDTDYVVGTGDISGTDAGLDSNFIPTAAGNCDGTGDTTVVDYVGSSDPYGLVLIYKSTRMSIGAREIPAVYASAALYPDLW